MKEARFDKGPIAKVNVEPFIRKYSDNELKFLIEGIPKLLELVIFELKINSSENEVIEYDEIWCLNS